MAQLAGLNRLAHVLRLDETPEFPDNHHLAGTKPMIINPLRHPARLWQVGALAMVQLVETLAMPSGGAHDPRFCDRRPVEYRPRLAAPAAPLRRSGAGGSVAADQ